MKFYELLSRAACVACAGIYLSGCASAQGGTSEGSTGTAMLSFELESGDEDLSSSDGFIVTIEQIALCIGSLSIGNQSSTADVATEFATEESAEFYDLADVAGGTYAEVSLGFCNATDSIANNTIQGDGQSTELNDLTGGALLITGTATKNTDSCSLSILLSDLSAVTVEAEDFSLTIEEATDTEVLVHVNPAPIISPLALANLDCANNNTVTISSQENASAHNSLVAVFDESFFELANTEEEGHSHEH